MSDPNLRAHNPEGPYWQSVEGRRTRTPNPRFTDGQEDERQAAEAAAAEATRQAQAAQAAAAKATQQAASANAFFAKLNTGIDQHLKQSQHVQDAQEAAAVKAVSSGPDSWFKSLGFGGGKRRSRRSRRHARHAKKSRRHAKKSRRHAKKSRRARR